MAITNVRIVIRCKANFVVYANNGFTIIGIGGTDYYGSQEQFTTNWIDYYTDYALNPKTGIAWTDSDITAMMFGVYLHSSALLDGTSYCTQTYARVTKDGRYFYYRPTTLFNKYDMFGYPPIGSSDVVTPVKEITADDDTSYIYDNAWLGYSGGYAEYYQALSGQIFPASAYARISSLVHRVSAGAYNLEMVLGGFDSKYRLPIILKQPIQSLPRFSADYTQTMYEADLELLRQNLTEDQKRILGL